MPESEINNETSSLLLAQIGRHARDAAEARPFFEHVLPLIAEGMGATTCEIWGAPVTGEALYLTSAYGHGARQNNRWARGEGTFAGRALAGETAVSLPESGDEALPHANGAAIRIPGKKRPYGLLWVGPHRRSPHKEAFLRAAVELLALGIAIRGMAETPQETIYHNVFDFALNAIFVTNDAGRYVTANPAACQMTGYSLDELQDMHVWDLAPEDVQETAREAWLAFRRQTYQEGEYQIQREDGRLITAEYRAVADVSPGRHLSVMHEITERKQTETELRQQEETYRSIFHGVRDAIIVEAMDGRILDANDAACAMYGYDRETFRTKTARDLAPDDHFVPLPLPGEPGQKTSMVETINVRANGERFPVELTGQTTMLHGEQVALAVVRDVSERKLAERKFRAVLENLDLIAVMLDRNGRVTFANDYLLTLSGWERAEVLGRDWFKRFIPPAIREEVRGIFRDTVRSGRFPTYYENEIIIRSGERRTIEWTNTILTGREGEIAGVTSVGRDVTEERRRQAALAHSEARLRAIFNNVQQGFIYVNPDQTIQRFNPLADKWARRIFDKGLRVGASLSDYILPQHQEGFARRFHKALAGEAQRIERVVRDEAGETIWLDFHYTPIIDESGTTIGVFLNTLEMTERRQMEEALRRSENTLRTVFQAAPIGIGLVRDRVFQWTNQDFCNMLGFTPEEVEGMAARPLYSSEAEYKRVGRILYDTTRRQQRDQLDTRWRRKDGTVIDVRVTLAPLEEEALETGEFVFTAVDITERIQAEREKNELLERLQDQTQQVRQIIDSVPDGVLLLDNEARLRLANPPASRYLALLQAGQNGGPIRALGGQPLAVLLTPDPSGLPHEVNVNDRIFEVVSQSMQGETSGWVMVIREITRQREIEQRAKEQQRLAAVGQLAAGIAHDFNNLMAVIVLYTQLIMYDQSLPPDMADSLQTIETQAKRASDLIDQILDFSRQSVLERQNLSLGPFVKEIGKLLGRTLPEHIQVQVEVEAQRSVIDADPTRIQQALMNLALNARDAMPNGGKLTITVEAIDVDGGKRPLAELEPGPWIRLTINDTGVGIPEDVLPHIYEPFFTTKAPGEGSGLGLAQVYGIIKQHDGHIDVDTHLGQGATFTLYLPAVNMSDPAAPVSVPGDFPRGNRERILLVEDDHPTLIAIRDTLRSLNYAPIAAPSGEAALEIIIQQGDEIDLIISDAVMPQMSGGELLQIVRQRGLDVPFLILSGHTLQTGEKEMLLAQGLDEWIAKPPSLHQLAQTIQSHLKKG